MTALTFFGAAREVTGSMHLVEVAGRTIALDCGMFQGRRAESRTKNLDFPLDPRKLDAVVLSHAHIDHSGRLPLLAKRGFTGRVYSTPATRDLCAVMLADSAHIQAEDAEYISRKLAKRNLAPVEPLYTDDDVRAIITQFVTVSIGHPFRVTEEITATYFETGHMLGSAGIALEIKEGSAAPLRLVFTGDLGRFNLPILRDPAPLPPCDVLISESTYGGRISPPPADLANELQRVITETVARGGKIIIPAFSVGRTQSVVYHLNRLMHEKKIAPLPVFIDSPLAVDATEIFRMHPDCYDADAADFRVETGDILGAGCCTYIRSVDQSKSLLHLKSPAVIIAASGMCENGRILHHLKNNIEDARNTVLIVGYQAAHTLGRRLVERLPRVMIFGQEFHLRAQVVVLNGFSGHADRDELLKMLCPLAANCRRAYLVHGETDQMEKLAASLTHCGFKSIEQPAPRTRIEI